MMTSPFLLADLANIKANANIFAAQTTREYSAGYSAVPYQQFNLALHVGDDPHTVQQNRILLLKALQSFDINQLVWLEQVHGVHVFEAGKHIPFDTPIADAVVCREVGVGCVIMTADCLPVILVDEQNTVVGCVHAGWRGLLAGVIEATLDDMDCIASRMTAWLGAAIGPSMFEVGSDVLDAFMAEDVTSQSAFTLQANGKYLADIYALARMRLARYGVVNVYGGERCTVLESDVFYSYRAAAPSHITGRMATIIALRPR